ncbi:hypothetical protein ANCDUO_08792 [Ancylostoma duodenale]|uniref:Fucosyltransferase n=1 Tax=Ancylostoma duodenale TaxID=51022 RepID=A0A0C2DEW2_9BILA|nr:hypothetical protein ANCDUO_08792 [Ancylostoma duodenale]
MHGLHLGLPSKTFIALDEFQSVEELGKYLNYLRHDDIAYARYFEWTKCYAKPKLYHSDAFCKLCEGIQKKKRMTPKDPVEFFSKNQRESL